MKRISLLLALIFICSVFLSSCTFDTGYDAPKRSCLSCGSRFAPEDSTGDVNSAYHKIDAAKAKEMIDAGNVTIIDVRTVEEYDAEHIPEAISLPNESIGKTQPEQLTDKDAVLLLYCRSGNRSKDASDKLTAMGYTQIYDFGGITDWPYETESSDRK